MRAYIIIVLYFLGIMILLGGCEKVYGHAGKTYVIKMTSNGFVPNKIELQQGDSVLFKNVDTVPHWPAANHRTKFPIYSEFDSKTSVAPEKSWNFVFEKEGTWGFYDHLEPFYLGEVIVKKNPNYQPSEKSILEKTHVLQTFFNPTVNKLKILAARSYYFFFPNQLDNSLAKASLLEDSRNTEKLTYFFEVAGYKKVFAKLRKESVGMAEYQCHYYLHDIGRVLYSVYQEKAFGIGDVVCGGAINHGTFEEYMDVHGVETLDKTINNICNSYETDLDVWNCYHGVGHGIMGAIKWDLPKGIKICNTLKNVVHRNKCYLGIFMDNNFTSETKWRRADDPVYPCQESWVESSDDLVKICYQNQIRSIQIAHNNDFGKTIDFCATLSEKGQKGCYWGVMQESAIIYLHDPLKFKKICELLPDSYFDMCFISGVQWNVFFYEPDLIQLSQQYCNSVEDKDKEKCYKYVGMSLPSIYSRTDKKEKAPELYEKLRDTCAKISTEYSNVCIEEAFKKSNLKITQRI